MNSCSIDPFRLHDESSSLRLYADHVDGMNVSDLAALYSRSEQWVRERLEGAHLRSEGVSVDLSPECPICSDSIWAAQVWD